MRTASVRGAQVRVAPVGAEGLCLRIAPAMWRASRRRRASRAQPAMHLFGRAGKTEMTQLAPEQHGILAAGRQPSLEVGEVGIEVCWSGHSRSPLGELSAWANLATVPPASPMWRLIARSGSPAPCRAGPHHRAVFAAHGSRYEVPARRSRAGKAWRRLPDCAPPAEIGGRRPRRPWMLASQRSSICRALDSKCQRSATCTARGAPSAMPRAYSLDRSRATTWIPRRRRSQPANMAALRWQQVDHASPLQVHQNRTVGPAFADCPIVHAQDARRRMTRQRQAAHQAQHGVATRRHARASPPCVPLLRPQGRQPIPPRLAAEAACDGGVGPTGQAGVRRRCVAGTTDCGNSSVGSPTQDEQRGRAAVSAGRRV